MATHQLGEFEFLDFRGELNLPRQEIETVQRPGVDGTSFWLTGARSQPSEFVSLVDCASLAAAHEQYKLYASRINGEPLKLIRANEDLEFTHAVKFIVLDVRPQAGSPARLGSATGGLSSSPAAILICRWTLQAVTV